MRVRLLSIYLVAGLIFSQSLLPNAYAAATVKLGAVCTTINQTKVVAGVKLVCAKSGTKKVWVKAASPSTATWAKSSSSILSSVSTIYNKMILADNYKDGGMFLAACNSLSKLVQTLPADTPKLSDLANVSYTCTGKSAIDALSNWLFDKTVRNYADCSVVSFTSRYIKTTLVDNFWAMMEYEYKNNLNEGIFLTSIKTNYPKLGASAQWDGGIPSEEVANGNLVASFIKFGPLETRKIQIRIDSYKYNEVSATGLVPSIQEVLVQLTDPKYGNKCLSIHALPK